MNELFSAKSIQWSDKKIKAHEQKIIAVAKKWQAERDMTGETLAMAIWNKFGYPTNVKNGKVQIWAGRQVIAEI